MASSLSMERKWCVSLALAALCSGCATQQLRVGDLLFHVVGQENHITEVTPGMIDHVAICSAKNQVIEAIPHDGVVLTSLDSVKRREDGYYLIGRVKGADAKRSVENAFQFLGTDYDSLFLPTPEAIYCSELVQLAYVDKKGRQLFGTIPMSFHDASGRITDYWTRFYSRHGMEVPEGQPGTNPSELSNRKNIKLKGRLR